MIEQPISQPTQVELSGSELASLAGGGVPQPTPIVEGAEPPPIPLYGNVPEPDFWNAVPIATGGKVPNRETFQQYLERAERVPELETQLQAANAKLQISPYANPFVENLNKLVSEGADAGKVRTYVQLATTDVNSMSEYEVLKTSLAFHPAGYNPAEIEALIGEKYGLTPDTKMEDLTPGQSASIRQAVYNAKAEITAQRTGYETPAQVSQEAAQRQARHADVVGRWEQAVPTFKPDVSFSFADDKSGIEPYEFKYNAPADVVNQARSVTMDAIRSNPDAFPPNENGYRAAQQFFNNCVRIGSQEDFQKAMFQDIYAKAMQKATLDKGGPVPNRPTTQMPAEQKPKAFTVMDALR